LGAAFDLPPCVPAFVSSLPNVDHLELVGATPHHLERILAKLTPTGPLRPLATLLVTFNEATAALEGEEDVHRLVVEFVPELRRCAGLPVMQALHTWELGTSLLNWVGGGEIAEMGRAQYDEWERTQEGWAEFRKAVEAAGVRLELGAIGHQEATRQRQRLMGGRVVCAIWCEKPYAASFD
jgi:hypothetical protein